MRPEALPYSIETERLQLRCWDPADAGALAEATTGHQTWFSFAPWVAKIQSVDEALAFTRLSRGLFDLMQDFAFAVWSRSQGRLVGGAQLHVANPQTARVTIDYWLRPDAAGNGYAREAVAALLDVAFRRALAQRVEILVAVNNAKSRAVPTALGFHKEGVMRRSMPVDGRLLDVVMYGLLGNEYVTSARSEHPCACADGLSDAPPHGADI